MQHRIYKCPHSRLSGYPRLRDVTQYAFYVDQSERRRSVRLIEVSVFQGVRIVGFHCISFVILSPIFIEVARGRATSGSQCWPLAWYKSQADGSLSGTQVHIDLSMQLWTSGFKH